MIVKAKAIEAIRHGLDATPPNPAERFGALIALRTVAFHMECEDMHAEIEKELDKLRNRP